MRHSTDRLIRLAGLVLGLGMGFRAAAAQPNPFGSPGTPLFTLDLSRTPVGELPTSVELVNGILEVALRNGTPMLKASAASEFRITLPQGQVLPRDFTLEFDLVPKQGSNPQDLSFEGTRAINQGSASAHILWHATGSLAVIGGGGDSYETPMPEDLQASLPGVLTKVVVEIEGPNIRLYTNGRRLFTLQKQFARGAVLRVFLGAQDGGTEAVYLAGLRVIAGTQLVAQGRAISAPPTGAPGYVPPPPGTQPPPPPQNQTPNPNPQPGFNSQSLASTGGISVAVTQGASGPVVNWTPLSAPAGYSVRRWKIDDAVCCNNASAPNLSGPPWQDVALTVAGTYVYEVTGVMSGGSATGQAQFIHFPTSQGTIATPLPTTGNPTGPPPSGPGTRPIATPVPPPPPPPAIALPAQPSPGAITPMPAPQPALVLTEGMLYKEASRQEIYVLHDSKLIHIPTPDALRFMGYTFNDVTVVADGGLAGYQRFQFASASATPGSLVFPIRPPEYAPILGLPSSIRVKVLGLDTYVTELRGWLWWTERLGGCDPEGDLKYGLEVDTDWALSQGIDLHRILWVGNLGPSGGGIGEPGTTPRAIATRPLITMELNAFTWHRLYKDNALKPEDWKHEVGCATEAFTGSFYYPFDQYLANFPQLNIGGLPDIAGPLVQRGPYVRVVGTLLTDNPHTLTLADLSTWSGYLFPRSLTSELAIKAEWNGAALDWHPGVNPLTDPSHYARWTEVHPPDLIEPATPPANPATMKAIGLAARPTECQNTILTVKPDVPQPSGATLAWEEIVGPETRWPKGVRDGQNYSQVYTLADRIIVHAQVCGAGLGNSPGRFKAFYRVWWK